MRKILLIGLLGVSVSTSSFAYKLLWSKEKITGGGQGHIERHPIAASSNANSCSVNGYHFDLKKKVAGVIFTDHFTHASNYTLSKHRYKIYYKLSSLGHAYEWWGEIELNPNEIWNENAQSQLTIQSSHAGTFDIQNVTEMTGDNYSRDEKHSRLDVWN